MPSTWIWDGKSGSYVEMMADRFSKPPYSDADLAQWLSELDRTVVMVAEATTADRVDIRIVDADAPPVSLRPLTEEERAQFSPRVVEFTPPDTGLWMIGDTVLRVIDGREYIEDGKETIVERKPAFPSVPRDSDPSFGAARWMAK